MSWHVFPCDFFRPEPRRTRAKYGVCWRLAVGLHTLGRPEVSASPIQRVELRVLSPVNLNASQKSVKADQRHALRYDKACPWRQKIAFTGERVGSAMRRQMTKFKGAKPIDRIRSIFVWQTCEGLTDERTLSPISKCRHEKILYSQSTICRESPTHQLRHFVGIAVVKRRTTVRVVYVLQGQTCLSLGFAPNLVVKLMLGKNYQCCLRFWFGGNLEKELGEAFSPPQFTVRVSKTSTKKRIQKCEIQEKEME